MTELEYLANCEKAKINLEQLGIKLYHPANENYTTVNKIDGENLIINFKKDTAPYKNMRGSERNVYKTLWKYTLKMYEDITHQAADFNPFA